MKHVVITTFLEGDESLLTRCENSVMDQDIKEMEHAIFIDKQDEQKGAMYGIVEMVGERDPEDVIHIVDGDDLLTSHALKRREAIFTVRPDILFVWGGYATESGARARFVRPWEGKEPRKIPWGAGHLKSFRYSLYRHIPKEYFMRDNKFIRTCADMALAWALMELAGQERCLCDNKKVLYIYNDRNPNNDHKLRREQQKSDEMYLRKLPPLQKLCEI
jgi:hypothetical protein